jgi:hypothetical protein
MYEDFDVFTMGHIHENAARNDARDVCTMGSSAYRHVQKQLALVEKVGMLKEVLLLNLWEVEFLL